MFRFKQKASSLVEYALILGAVLLALTGMNIYLKRGVQARIKDMSVHFIAQDLFSTGEHQYVAGQSKSDSTTKVEATLNQQVQGRNTTTYSEESTLRTGIDYSVGAGWEELLPDD